MESEDKKPIFTKRLILIILAVILLILIIFLLLHKCGGGGNNYKVQSITLSPTSIGIEKGQNYPIYAYVVPEDAKDKSIIWSSSDENVATVDAAGLVTGVNEGTATITATAGDGSGVTGQCVVTVGNALPNLEQIQLNKSTYTVKVGKSVLVEVTPVPSTAQLTDIKYSIADTSVATVDMYGTIKGVKKGTTTLTVTANNGGVTATATVKVTNSSGGSGNSGGTSGGGPSGGGPTGGGPTTIAVTGINLPSDGCYKLRVGNEYTLSASVVPVNATNQELKWESSDTSIATVTTTGKVIASTKTGTVTIKVTAKSGVYSTYEIRVVSKGSKEGSCSSSNTGGGGNTGGSTGGGTGGNNGGGNEVTTPTVGEIKGDGVLTEAKVAPVYNKKTYNLTINGYIQSNTINRGTDGWMQDANCSISINGILPPYYKATYQAPNGNEVEFRTRAYVSDITGPVTVRVYLYDRLLDSNGDPKLILNESKEVTVCGKIKDKKINIDNQPPSCKLTYSGTTVDDSIKVEASDVGGSGLHKVVWENGDTTKFSSDSITRNITSQFDAGTRNFVATIYDKAGNATSCGIYVENLDKEGTQISGTDLTSTLKSIKLSVSNTTLYPGSTTTLTVMGTYADGSTAPIDNYAINEYSVTYLEFNSSTSVSFNPSDVDAFFGNSTSKTAKFSVVVTDEDGYATDMASNSVTLTLLKNGKVTCTAKPGEGYTGRNGTWYKGDAGVTCDAEKGTDTKITKIGVCFASLSGTCSPAAKSITATSSATAKLGTPTGQGKMCVAYATNKSSSITTECFNNQNFDNKKPTCTVSIDRSVFMYKIDDGNDSSGLNKLTGKNPANLNNEANATTQNFRYDGDNKPASTDEVSDMVGNKANCSVPTITKAQLEAMQKAAEDEDNNGKVSIQTSDVIGEMWICADGTSDIENCTSGYKLNSNASQNFTATFTRSDATTSILGALKKFDDKDVKFEWSSTNKYVVSLSSTTGKQVTGHFVGVGDSKITVCVAGTKNCASKMVTVDPLKLTAKSLNAYHSGKMSVGTRETIKVSVTPYGASKDVKITSSNNSVVSVESNNVIVARKVGTAVITVTSVNNPNLVDTITIVVTGKDTTKPTVSIRERQTGANIHVSFTAKDDSQVTLKYGLVKGSSCTPSTTSSTVGSSITETKVISVKGTYTACIEAIDASGNKTTYRKEIDANGINNDGGKISCSVSGVTSGNLRIGKSALATISCTSDEKINVNNLSFSSGSLTASATSRDIVTNDYYRVVINVTIKSGTKTGESSVWLNSGALSTSTSSSSRILVGTYKVIAEEAPTIKSSCSIRQDGSYLIASVTAENVQVMEYDTRNWASGSSSNTYRRTFDISKEAKYTFSAKIYYKDGRAAETISCSYSHSGAKEDSSLKSPSISTSWSASANKVSATITLPSGISSNGKYCTTSGSSCTPSTTFSGSSTTISKNAEGSSITFCANYTTGLKISPTTCKTYTFEYDTKPPTCQITLAPFAYGTTMSLTAKASDSDSGLASGWTAGWTNQAEGYYTTSVSVPAAGETKTVTFTIKDKAGNQGDCSIRITGTKECRTGYSEKNGDGYCYKYDSAPKSGGWTNISGSYSPSKGNKTPTRANASASDKTAYEYYSANVSKCTAQYGPYVTTCWEERIYTRNESTCASGTYKIGNSCYERGLKIVVPKVTG